MLSCHAKAILSAVQCIASKKATKLQRFDGGQTTVSDFDLSDSRKPTMASDSWSGETRAHSIPLSHPNDNDFL